MKSRRKTSFRKTSFRKVIISCLNNSNKKELAFSIPARIKSKPDAKNFYTAMICGDDYWKTC